MKNGIGKEKELIIKLILMLSGWIPGTDWMGKREQGREECLQGVKLGIQRRVCCRIWGSALSLTSGTALWAINSRPSYFLMKVTYHRYISVTAGVQGKKARHVQVRAEY